MKLPLLFACFGAAGLGGCALYVPTTAVMPLIRAPKEADVRVSIHPSGRLEATAAYSPLAHVVLSGTGMLGLRTKGKEYLRTRQGELGLGGYWPLGHNERWRLNTTIGAGLADVSRRDCAVGCDELRGRYSRGFGQVGIAYNLDVLDLDVSLNYRLSRVQFTAVATDAGPLADFGSYRHDLMLAFRHPLNSLAGKWYVQSTIGTSISNLRAPGSEPYGQTQVSDRWYAGGQPTLFASLGVGYYFCRPQP